MKFDFVNSGVRESVDFPDRDIREIYIPLLKHLTALQKEKGSRILVLLAAPPGAGKTTLTSLLEHLAADENTTVCDPADLAEIAPVTVIGMDGFHHYQDYLLTHITERNGEMIPMVKVKGAPETFDLPLLTERLSKVAAGENCGWPIYDRLLHNPVEDAVQVKGEIILMEGNYLLLDREGWRELKALADYTIRITAAESLLRERLVKRKISTGADAAAAERFVDYSDMYNVRTCLRDSAKADLELEVTENGMKVK